MSEARPARLRRGETGQTMVEFAIAIGVVLVVLIGAVQIALVYHARTVTTTAVQEGARFAASEGRTAADGMERARSVLESGLGSRSAQFSVSAEESGETVTVQAEGDYPLIIPWVSGASSTISATAEVRKEGFRSGP
jgi:Flp pilus assembly protein TadG